MSLSTRQDLHLPRGSILVEDADEEIFLLYTNKQLDLSSSESDTATGAARVAGGGLGFHSDAGDVLNLTITAKDPWNDTQPRKDLKGKSAKGKGKGKAKEVEVEVELHQSLANLRHRTGDTGSVLWRLSLHLAKYFLTLHHFPHPFHPPLLANLASSTILELGSGTGFLGLALRSIFDSASPTSPTSRPRQLPTPSRSPTSPRKSLKDLPSSLHSTPSPHKWTFSDQLENLDLILRNLRSNSVPPSLIGDSPSHPFSILELDWLVESREYLKSLKRPPEGGAGQADDDSRRPTLPNLILAVDCIYNPSLSVPLAHTILRNSGPDTVVVVASELRDSEPLELFLTTWLDQAKERFGADKSRVARLGWDLEQQGETGEKLRDRVVGELRDSKFVVWVGWCE